MPPPADVHAQAAGRTAHGHSGADDRARDNAHGCADGLARDDGLQRATAGDGRAPMRRDAANGWNGCYGWHDRDGAAPAKASRIATRQEGEKTQEERGNA